MISLAGLEFDLEDVISWDPDRVAAAIERAKTFPDNPKLPPRKPEKKEEDGMFGEVGEMISERILNLLKHENKYQDFETTGVLVDNVILSGTIEIKVLNRASLDTMLTAIERHLSHSSCNFLISILGDRCTGKFKFFRITDCTGGIKKLKTVKNYSN